MKPGEVCETDRAIIEDYLFTRQFSFVFIEEFIDPDDKTISVVPRVGKID